MTLFLIIRRGIFVMENNRTILAIALIVLLWSGYSMFFAPKPPQEAPSSQIQENAAVEDGGQISSTSDNAAAVAENRMVSVANESEPVEITVTNKVFKVILSSMGGVVKDISLNQYRESNEKDSKNYELFEANNFENFSLKTFSSNGINIPVNLNYTSNVSGDITIDSEQKVVFTAEYDGFIIQKIFVFHAESYDFDLIVNITNNKENTVSGAISLSMVTPFDEDKGSEMYSFEGPVSYDGNELLEDDIKDLNDTSKVYKNSIVWSGFTSKYFLFAIHPDENNGKIVVSKDGNNIFNNFSSQTFSLNPDQDYSISYTIYAGPKKVEDLAKSGKQFEEIIHYGFFHPLAKPLMVVLKFFYGFLGNYGLAIILLTVCIKIIFWPLTQKSYKSMKGMQKLQPEMKKLREKFGSDKQRLNQEMMKFYKENKVNPMGGCLPMLIQIPVFFALYRVLLGSIELRHAPFMLWITDLSAKDPYYVTPLIMGVTMFLQQKMTPTNMDPTQEKIMLIMPVVFTFMFLNFPSGLVIYWLVNNVLTILQQYLIRRQAD